MLKPPPASLIYMDGSRRGMAHSLGSRTTLGRGDDVDVQVLDANVSRRHAEIYFEGGFYWIKDLGSRNGIDVNGARVTFAPLTPGVVIRLGARSLLFQQSGPGPFGSNPGGAPVPPRPAHWSDPSSEDRNLPFAAASPSSPSGSSGARLEYAPDNLRPADALRALRAPAPKPAGGPRISTSKETLPPIDGNIGLIRSELASDAVFAPKDDDNIELRKTAACLRAVFRVSEALVGLHDPQQLLDRLLEEVLDALPADRAYALLRDESSGEFTVRASRFREERHSEDQRLMSRTVLKKVVEEKVSLLVADASSDKRFEAQQSVVSQGIRSIMCAPLCLGSTVFGVLTADTLRSKNAFDGQDLGMLTALARQASVALEHVRLMARVEEDARTRGILERYLSPELVDQVVNNHLELRPGGTLQDLTIMFSDIRGFTTLSESMAPDELVELLNEYFGIMVEVLFRHGGTLDKFIGDSIMAFWGAPVKRDDDALRAVECALEMQAKLRDFNAMMTAAGQPVLPVGIGINTGQAIVGNLGSSRRWEYTVLGDAVNVASRLQGIAGGGQVLVSGATFEAIRECATAQQLPDAQLKGRSGLVEVYDISAVVRPPAGS